MGIFYAFIKKLFLKLIKILLRCHHRILMLIVPALHIHIVHHPDGQQIQIRMDSPSCTHRRRNRGVVISGQSDEVFFSLHIRLGIQAPQFNDLRQYLIDGKGIKSVPSHSSGVSGIEGSACFAIT